ncbi:MAG: iron ABC transporter permease [Firmicutes bacterium]|nr:iron ABC transporter permease [Bacillota bacterium]
MREARGALRQLLKDPLLFLGILAIFALIAVFIIYPLVKVFLVSIQTPDGIGLDVYEKTFSSWYMRRALYNSLLIGLLAAVLGTAIGFLFAYGITRTDMPLKPFFNLAAIMPVISPPFVGAVSILLLFGNNGLITSKLLGIYNYPIYGLRGLLLAQVVTFFPVAYLNLKGIMESISPVMEEAALDLGASRWQVFRRIFLPLTVPGIASAMLVLFIESLADFGNPLVLSGSHFPTLAVQAYLQITGMYDLPGGSALAMVLLIPALTAFVVQKYWVSRKGYVTVTGKPTKPRIQSVSPAMKWVIFSACMLVAIMITLFYGIIIIGAFSRVWGVDHSFTLRNFQYVLDVGWQAVKNTLFIAVTSTPVAGILGMIIAFLVVRRRFLGRSAMEFTSLLSYALPGTVVGIGYVLAFNTPPLLLTGTALILIANFVFRYIPVGIQGGVAALKQIDPAIEEAAVDLGADAATSFRKVVLPLITPAFFSGLVYSFVRAMTAISAAIFLVSADWQLMTVHILSQVSSGRLGAAAAFSVVLILMIMMAIGIIRVVVNKAFRVRVETRF